MAAAGSSRFAVTSGLMRQYMREQQQQGAGVSRPPPAVSLMPSPSGAAEETADARTMQLFPTGAAGTSQPSRERPEAQATAPLTIFYDGRVLVFEDFPAEKAKALMQLAESESSPAAPAEIVPPAAPQRSTAAAAAPQPPALSDMPIARKASLQRFLQKRKHRITTTDPYKKATASPAEKDAAVKPVKDEPASWLGL